MAFTYDLTTDIGEFRFTLGDTVSGSGVRADGSNFSDEEITLLLNRNGGTVTNAVIAACEMLSLDWAKVATVSSGSVSEQLGNISRQWADRAKEMRDQYGARGTSFSIGFDRSDGYSEVADGRGI